MSRFPSAPRHTGWRLGRQRTLTALIMAGLAAAVVGFVTAPVSPLLAVAGGLLAAFAVGLDMYHVYQRLDTSEFDESGTEDPR